MAESWRKSISDGVNIYSKRGDEAGFTLLHRDNESSYTDDRPLLVAGKPEQSALWLRLTAKDPERQKAALDFQRAVDHLFSFGGFRGEDEENPIHLAKKFRRLAGFTDDEITELVDVAAQAFAEAQARSAQAAGEPAAAAS